MRKPVITASIHIQHIIDTMTEILKNESDLTIDDLSLSTRLARYHDKRMR